MSVSHPVFRNFALPVAPSATVVNLTERQRLLELAATAEHEVEKGIRDNKRKLYTIQIPTASLMGLGVYALLLQHNPNQATVLKFQDLLKAHQQVTQEILRLEQNGLQSETRMPTNLRTALAQLKTTLYKGGSPYYTQKYMEDVRQFAADWQNISVLDNQMEAYQGALKRVLGDRKGLQKLATEPIILAKLRLPKHAAVNLASRSGEEFLQKLFEQSLSETNMTAYQIAFKRLLTANQRMARLVAGVVTFALVGLYTMLNKTQASKIYERGF